MPIKRKLIIIGRSYAVTLPKTWVQDAQEKAGREMEYVAMEVNGHITIKPVFNGKNLT